MTTEFFEHEEDKPAKRKYTKSGKYEKKAEVEKPGKRAYKKRGPKKGFKKASKKSPLNAEHSSVTFLFFTNGKDEFTEPVPSERADQRAREIFSDPDYVDLQQIYFMKPLKLYNRPVMEVVNL